MPLDSNSLAETNPQNASCFVGNGTDLGWHLFQLNDEPAVGPLSADCFASPPLDFCTASLRRLEGGSIFKTQLISHSWTECQTLSLHFQLSCETKTNWFDLMLSCVERHESWALSLEFIDFIKHGLPVFAKCCNFPVISSNCSASTDSLEQCHFLALILHVNLLFPIDLLHQIHRAKEDLNLGEKQCDSHGSKFYPGGQHHHGPARNQHLWEGCVS